MSKIIYTTKEAAQLLNVTQRTIQLWADSGILEVGKTPGGHRRISAESVEQLLRTMDGKLLLPSNEENADSEMVNMLLVDDDPAFQKLMCITIGKWQLPLNILLAKDGYEALIIMGHYKPQILLTDLDMPNIDGVHMLKKIRENTLLDNIKIAVVTGLDAEQIKESGQVADNIEILAKPVNFELLKTFLVNSIQLPTSNQAKSS